MAAKRTTAQGGFAQRNAARDFARQTQKAGPVTGQRGFAAGEMRAERRARAGVLPLGPRRGAAVTGTAKQSAPVGPMTGQRQGFRGRRNATEREQGPGRERKPRVGKEEGPRFRGADYESPTAYFLSVKKVGKER